MGFELDGQPFVLPTSYARVGDRLYLHGSAASRMMRHLESEAKCCVTVTLVDGLVLARSAFHHSMNYRSVVILGEAFLVSNKGEKLVGLRAMVEHIAAGRWVDCRPPSTTELRATTLLSIELEEGSAKLRSGPPMDDEEDLSLPFWSGVVPLSLHTGPVEPDPTLLEGIEPPAYATDYVRPGCVRSIGGGASRSDWSWP